MTNDLIRSGEIVSDVPHEIALQGVESAALKEQLREAIGLTETAIMRVAVIWRELVRRGEDMSDVKFALAPFMLPVAEGRLLPALVVAMAGQVRSLQRIADLPIHDQKALAEGRMIKILKPDYGVIEKPLKRLSFPELAAIVRGGKIMSVEDQRRALRQPPARRARKSTVVSLRLSADTYNDAALAAADAGMGIDDYLRRLIIAGLRRDNAATA